MSSGVLLYYFLSFFLLSSLWWIVVVSHWTASSNILFFFSFQIRRLIMAKTTEGNEEKMKTPSQDGQGHFAPSLPPTEVLIGSCEPDADDKMRESKKKKKKKSRGNRKAQHKRRRLRRQLQKVNENTNLTEPTVVCRQDEQPIQVGWSCFRSK